MEHKERLINLIIESVNGCARNWAEVIANHLIENGVIVPPCKVGQTVYALDLLPDNCKCADCDNYYAGGMGDISECEKTKDGYRHHKCIEIHEERAIMQDILSWLIFDDFGETVFLTREEAEKALAERGKE